MRQAPGGVPEPEAPFKAFRQRHHKTSHKIPAANPKIPKKIWPSSEGRPLPHRPSQRRPQIAGAWKRHTGRPPSIHSDTGPRSRPQRLQESSSSHKAGSVFSFQSLPPAAAGRRSSPGTQKYRRAITPPALKPMNMRRSCLNAIQICPFLSPFWIMVLFRFSS